MKPATTVVKTCGILDVLGDGKFRSVTEIARETGLLPSDVHRILASLRACGYFEQDSQTRRYGLGTAFLRIGLNVLKRNRLRKEYHRKLARISRELDVATHLALFDAQASEVVLIDEVDCEADTSNAFIGNLEPPHSTALGKVILSNLPRDAVNTALRKHEMRPYTQRTITDVSVLMEQLVQIGQYGYAVDVEESSDGVCCVATAVRDSDRKIIGAIGVSMPSAEFRTRSLPHLAARLSSAALPGSHPLVSDDNSNLRRAAGASGPNRRE